MKSLKISLHCASLFRYVLFLLFSSCILAGAQSAAPVLYFSDITSGPKAGNSDASSGRTANLDGAIVTVWGINLGASQGSSRVACNGADAASYYSWGDANAPADLYAFHKMQMISFQISHLATDGIGEIRVTVNGLSSNPLPFTVRDGRIVFVAVSGDDNTGDGTWTRPYRGIQKAVTSLGLGDIAYVLDGVAETVPGENDACVSLDSDGTPTHPKALVAYPGASVTVGSDTSPRGFWNFDGTNNIITTHWVVAKFRIHTREVGIYTDDDFRVVGNWFTAPQGNGLDGTINIVGTGVYVLGNELVDCGSPNCYKLYHAIYGKGERRDDAPRAETESNRDIGWNYIHDCKSNRAINIYSEQLYSAYIDRHRVHDNVIINQRGDGIMLGYYVTGDNWIFNNLLIRTGLGPEWDEPSYHCGIRINTGHENISRTDVYCYNNTLYGCGYAEAIYTEETGHLLISPEAIQLSTVVHLRNNIVMSTGEPYMASESVSLPPENYRNCWFGRGDGPLWDTGAINSDPLFVNATIGDFRLNKGSPCVNSGIDVTAVVARDLYGMIRKAGEMDLGVFEYDAMTSIDGKADAAKPKGISLRMYPNPVHGGMFGRNAVICDYSIPSRSRVVIEIFSLLGCRIATVADRQQEAGSHRCTWNIGKEGAGIYFVRMRAGGMVTTRELVIAR